MIEKHVTYQPIIMIKSKTTRQNVMSNKTDYLVKDKEKKLVLHQKMIESKMFL